MHMSKQWCNMNQHESTRQTLICLVSIKAQQLLPPTNPGRHLGRKDSTELQSSHSHIAHHCKAILNFSLRTPQHRTSTREHVVGPPSYHAVFTTTTTSLRKDMHGRKDRNSCTVLHRTKNPARLIAGVISIPITAANITGPC